MIDFLMDPNVAYLLLVAGTWLMILSVLSPGTGIIEIGAAIMLVLAGWATYSAAPPINWWALVLLVVGVVPFLLALRRTGQYIYLAVSIAALAIGSAYLFQGDGWLPVVNPWLALIVSTISGVLLWILATKTLEATVVEPTHDMRRLIGMRGEARTPIHLSGSVYVDGELWSARSSQPVAEGEKVIVVGREGFILLVEPE